MRSIRAYVFLCCGDLVVQPMTLVYGLRYVCFWQAGLLCGLNFNPCAHPIATEKSVEIPHGIPTPTKPANRLRAL